MRTRLLIGLLGIGWALAPSVSSGYTYRFIDESGVTHFTNAPTHPWYQRFVPHPAPAPRPRTPPRDPYAREVEDAAERYGIDSRLVKAIITVESAGNPWAVSSKGAQGLMQLMPATAAQLGVRDPFNPRQNVEGGVRHLRSLLDSFGNLPLALAAYNAGADPVRSYRGIPPYRETQEYVKKVLRLYSPGADPAVRPAGPPLQRVYRIEDEDGTVVYTNLPPAISSAR